MKKEEKTLALSEEVIISKIYTIRGQKVMLDEYKILKFQIGISSWGGRRNMPLTFTEQGVATLSSVLNSDQAIMVNIQIIRVFTKMRQLLESHKDILRQLESLQMKDIDQDRQILLIFEYLRQLKQAKLEEPDIQKRKRIGFQRRNEP